MRLVRCSILLALLTVSLFPHLSAGAQEEPVVPPDIRAHLRPGWERALYARLPIGPNGRQVEMQASHHKVPEDTAPLHPIPFLADFYLRQHGKLQRVHSVAFTVEATNVTATVKWLHPRTHRGPIVLLHSVISDGDCSNLILFPNGIEGKALLQEFIGGGEGGGDGTCYDFDQVDRAGGMIVLEQSNVGSREWTERYTWNGQEFATRSKPYFVIAASSKTRAEAETFRKSRKFLEGSVILSSDYYPGLKPGYFIVLAGRFENRRDADTMQTSLRQEGVPSYIRNAY